MLSELTQRVTSGESLSFDEMSSVIDEIMQGRCAAGEIGPFLLALRAKGEAVDELAGAAAAMRRHMTPIHSTRANLVDTCGTGGGGKGTFNISTAAAIVAAAAGASVAKHGNRKITSKTGSADVLAALGVNVEAPVAVVERCLDELGVCFCFAPLLHGAMKHVSAVRRELGVPTIFNLLGPLCNPAGAPFQVLGVGRPETRTLLAAALARLGTRRAVVVCGEDGLGEISICGATNVTLVENGVLMDLRWSPDDFGLAEGSLNDIAADDPTTSAAIIRSVLAGELGAARNIVVMNAAAALWVSGQENTLARCAHIAEAAIDTGEAAELLARLVQASQHSCTDAPPKRAFDRLDDLLRQDQEALDPEEVIQEYGEIYGQFDDADVRALMAAWRNRTSEWLVNFRNSLHQIDSRFDRTINGTRLVPAAWDMIREGSEMQKAAGVALLYAASKERRRRGENLTFTTMIRVSDEQFNLLGDLWNAHPTLRADITEVCVNSDRAAEFRRELGY